jgi:hypothetical protein
MNNFLQELKPALLAKFKHYKSPGVTSSTEYPANFLFTYNPCNYIFIDKEIEGLIVIDQYTVEKGQDFDHNVMHLTNASNHPEIPGFQHKMKYWITESNTPGSMSVEMGTPHKSVLVKQTLNITELVNCIDDIFSL